MTDQTPQRIRLSRAKGWKMPPNTVKVDRSTPWGNPYIVGKHGTAEECVDQYLFLLCGMLCISVDRECALAQKVAHQYLADHMHELKGKNLACWCRADKPCHADILLLAVNGGDAELEERMLEILERDKKGKKSRVVGPVSA